MAYFSRVRCITVLLYVFLTLQSQLATGSRFVEKDGVVHSKNMNGTQPHMHHHHHHHHQNPNDPDVQQFFKIPDLKLGKKIPIYFPMKEPSKRPPLLSKEEADLIPFSSSQLPKILQLFSIPKESLQAKTMERAIESCEGESSAEIKFCATSMNSLYDLAHEKVFGRDLDIKVTTTNIDRSKDPSYTPILQNYTISENPQEISTPRVMACHLLVYPYSIRYCHRQLSDHRMFKIPLVGDNGWKIEALGICHMDTSTWDPSHIAFLVLNTQPGKSPVCHFFSEEDLVVLPSAVNV